MLDYKIIRVESSQPRQKAGEDYLAQLLALSRDWAEEKTCPAYYANEEADFLEKDIYIALDGERIVAYAYGEIRELTEATSYNQIGEKAFDLEELYVVPAWRNRGVGKELYRFLEEQIRDQVDVIGVTAVSYQYEKLLRLYTQELGFGFKYAQLAKRTDRRTLSCHPITEAEKKNISGWQYEEPYAIYNLPPYEEQIAKGQGFANPKNCFYAFYDDERLVGFINLLEEDAAVFLGIGVDPACCGQGYGPMVCREAQALSQRLFPGKTLYLEVRTWNRRAIRCYEKAGFRIAGAPFTQTTGAGEGEFYRMISS